ncbi:hypothetical protein [Patulibacter defluvii]|uniref:hypothetical protein n=1 Tax=Patulibacter defluvii TaxID=3095358 RepID=UPI002A74A03E|nr:hypothetical protein [Patulibacter sp. DM4]
MARRSWVAAATAAAVTGALTLPAGAEAARPRSFLGLAETLTAVVKLDLVGVLTGQKQLFDEVKTVTCPLTQGVVDVLKPVLGASVATLETIGCGDNVVDYQFVTKLRTGSGEIVRKQLALVAVPTKLNVDADPEPDVIATISVINLGKFEIRIERLPGEKAELPLQIEALIDDPLNGGIPRQHINVGYDARNSRAPQRWTATATLPKTAQGTTDIDIRVTQTGAGPELTTLGGLYDGTADRRTRPMGGRLKFSPAPSLSRVGLSFGPTRTVVRAGSGTPTALDAEAVLDDGTSRKDIGVQLNALPETLSFALDDLGPDRRTIGYEASAPVERVAATYTDTVGGAVTTKVVAKARSLPTGMTVEQTSARSASFTARGGTLGSVEAGFANGDPQLLDRDHPYVNVQTDGPVHSFAGRIDDLRSASFNAADGIVADLQLGDGPRKPLDAVVNTPDLDVNARVSDLPRHIGFRFAPATGTINYDAFGETIQAISAKATAPRPLIGRATRVEGEIRDLPPKADIAITPGGGGIDLRTTAPIGQVEALLSSGPDGGLAPDQLGADVVDTTERFVAHARVKGLQAVKLEIDKTDQGEFDGFRGDVELATQPIDLRYRGNDGIDARAEVRDLPKHLRIGFSPRKGTVNYDAFGEAIQRISVTATGNKPFIGRATRVDGTIRDLPPKADVTISPGNGGIDLRTTAPIGQIEALLSSGPDGGLAPGETGADIVDTTERFVAHGRVDGFRAAQVAIDKTDQGEFDGLRGNLELSTQPIALRYRGNDDLRASARIEDLPKHVQIGFSPRKGTIDYDAHGDTIQRIAVAATSSKPLVGRASRVEGEIRDLPPQANLTIAPDSSGITFRTSAPIGRAEALLSSGPDGGLKADERGADVVDRQDAFVAHARIDGLREVTLAVAKAPVPQPGGESKDELQKLDADLQIAKQPVVLRYAADEISASAGIQDVPEHVTVGFAPRTGKFAYDAHGATIDRITAKATASKPLIGRATRIEGAISGLPAKADLTIAPGGGGIDLSTSAPIGRAEALLSSGPAGGLAAGERGATVLDTDAAFVAQARIDGLRDAKLAIEKAPVKQEDGSIKDVMQKLDARMKVGAQPLVIRYTGDPACADEDPNTGPTTGICFDGDLTAVPDDVHVTFDRPAGSITYDASAPIDSLGARVDSGTTLFGDAKKIDARIDRLPKKVTVGFKPAEGFDDGVDVSTDERVGRIKAKITDGATAAPELVDGQAKVALRKLPGQFAIAAQLYEIAGGRVGLKSYAPDPAKPEEKSTRVAAELHLGALPGGQRQDVDLDFQADKPGDAVDQPLNLTGRIDDIPDDMTLDLDANHLKFTSSTKIPQVVVDARNLPQGKPGEDLKGKPQNVKARITDVPTLLDVDLKNLVVAPNGPLGQVDFELWDTGSPRPALPADGRNKLEFDKRTGLHIQGRLLPGLREATLTLPSGTGPVAGKLKVKTKFAANPAPLDLVLRSGIGIDRSRVELTASDLKTEQEFAFVDHNGLRVDWTSNEPGTDLHLGVSTEAIGTNVDVTDLPTQAFFCAAGGQECLNGYIMGRFPINGKQVELPLATSVRTQANEPFEISGQICLVPTTEHGTPSGAVYDSCIEGTAKNRVEIDRLEVQSMTFGVFTGETPQRNGSGDGPEEDDLLLLHIVTDATGIRARNINIRNTTADKLNIIRAGWTGSHPNYVREGEALKVIPRAPGLPPRFTMLADLSLPPGIEDSTNKINCGASHLVTTVQLPLLGTTNIFPAASWVTNVCG